MGRHVKGRAKREGGPLLIGRNALRELLKHDPERIKRVYVGESHGSDVQALIHELRRIGVPLDFISTQELTELAHSDSHQSFAAVVSERAGLTLDALIERMGQKKEALIVALDGIQDPQNLGTIFRAAECFGADCVVWSKNRTVALSPAVTKASAGASELVPFCVISNLAEALRRLKQEGFWAVGAEAVEGAEELPNFSFPEKTIVVLGSEGFGLKDLSKNLCDFLVKIPLLGKINSLNVSQAGSVMLYAYRARKSALPPAR